MIIYCFKCKLKTETLDGIEKTSSNGRNMIKGTCSVCGTKKSVFQSSKDRESVEGKGFSLNNLINNLPIEFHQYAEKGEYIREVRSMINKNIRFVVRVHDTIRE